MWAPLVQLQPQHTVPLSLPKWVILEDLELVPQGYKGGNVMVEEAPITFSPFSSANCYGRGAPYFFFSIYLGWLYTLLSFLFQ